MGVGLMREVVVVRTLHILNFGAGVQSTALALLAAERKLVAVDGREIVFDYAIFADTGEEPQDPGVSVASHLVWIRDKLPFPILIGTAGRLGEHLMYGTNSSGGRFASIPAFTLHPDGKVAITRRQCTSEYKIKVVERVIRREVLGLLPKKHISRDVHVNQYIGISTDEVGRMIKARARAAENPVRWSTLHYPLVEHLGWSRGDCRKYLSSIVPHRVPRSACVFCPYHSNEEWQSIKMRGGADWDRVVEIDTALRAPGNVLNRRMDCQMFLHRSCKPITEIDFAADKNGDKEMAGECQGMCGN